MSVRERVGPYRVLEEIGVGGMGEVYLALDPRGQTVALKVLHPAIARDEVARRRLEREVATMRRVRSPYVAEVVDADFTARRPYVVTRYVQGKPLDQVIREQGPLRGAALSRVARGLLRALQAIHASEVVHRDLKPGNVILVDGDPVVIDFGLAHVLDATRLTRTGMAIGTPGYLAPEILEGGRAGPAADVFSWAATVVFAATGRSPYGHGPVQALFSRVLLGRFDLTGVPPTLTSLVGAGLRPAPGRRPSLRQLLAGLDEQEAPGPVDALPPDQLRRAAARGLVHIGLPALSYVMPVLVIVGIMLGLAGTYARRAGSRARRRVAAQEGHQVARLRALLAAAVAVPLGVGARLIFLAVALAVGYALALGLTRLAPPNLSSAASGALPVGLLVACAVALRVWYAATGPPARVWLLRLAVPMLSLAFLLVAVAVVRAPVWWPLAVPLDD